ncbi:MAG: HEPN domain-containing protein [Actinomycetota bacterium]|nr:HEPN domain-containing protein [Actinomycetota bacterium]
MLRDEAEYERWLDASRSSSRVADLASGAGEPAAACFHAEQAAQLAIKALLHGLAVGDRAFGHSLVGLGRAVEDSLGVVLPEDLRDALARLARHDIPIRYPDALPEGLIREHYRQTDAAQARADAGAVAEFAAILWAEAADPEDELDEPVVQ